MPSINEKGKKMLIVKEKESDRELFIRYGSSATEAMFDFPCNFFRRQECEGVVAYRIESGCAVVFGGPICPHNETAKLVEAFHKFCDSSKISVVYVIVSKSFADWLSKSYCKISMEICDELIFDPIFDPCLKSRRLKHRVDIALKHGLTVHEYIPTPVDANIENALQEIGIKWQRAIKGPSVFLGHLNFFESYQGKRWFYVKDGEKITSMMMLSRIDSKDGWLLKFLVSLPEAFHDTSELLMVSVLETLRKENCRFLSKGMVPADQIRSVKGLGSFAEFLAKGFYKAIGKIFKFKKRKDYWLRYFPKEEPAYLLFSNSHIGIREIRALMKVFKRHY